MTAENPLDYPGLKELATQLAETFAMQQLVDAAELAGRISVDVCECNPPMVTSIGRCGYCCGIRPQATAQQTSPRPPNAGATYAPSSTPSPNTAKTRKPTTANAEHGPKQQPNYSKPSTATADKLNPVTP